MPSTITSSGSPRTTSTRGSWRQAWPSCPGIQIDPGTVETNIVIFAVDDAPGFVERLADRVELSSIDARHVRAVTHLDVGRSEIDAALAAFADVVGSGRSLSAAAPESAAG